MTCPPREDALHPFQVVDIEFAYGVVVLDALNPLDAVLFDEVDAVGDRIA